LSTVAKSVLQGVVIMAKGQAVAYLRVSGAGQIGGDGFTRQRQTIAEYAKRAGLELVGEFRDEGVSGTNELADRPGLGALVDRIESNGVRVVLVENATRLGRDLLVSEVILNRFRSLGVKVIDCDGGQDLTVGDDNPTGKLIRQILGAVAEFEKSCLVAKLAGARRRLKAAGERVEGRKPFGDRPGEAEVVERIKALRRKPKNGERLSFAQIADKLNAEGVPTRRGGLWRPSTIGQILGR
jgi:DNA invertase Pin-like site-specific DNA recombinase